MTDMDETEPSAIKPVIGGNEIKKLGYNLYLRIPDNRMECRCSYVPHEQGSMITRDELTAFLKQYSILAGIDQEVLDEIVVKAAAGQQLVDLLLASGTAPVNGADEHITMTVQPSAVVYHGTEEVTNVDMHIVQTFLNVSNGDEIGRIIPAEPGTAGVNISGQPVPPQPGKPMKCKIGKNILVEDDGKLLVAAATGRLCQTSGEISVEEEYIVKGDVNFRVGSINFKGVVEVRGDVLDNFHITATKGLTVTGNIGACTVVSDGDITFCGMDGQDKGRIICGGNLRAHFIHDVVVECAGDVVVDVEIHNCVIRTLGRIVVDKGAISGGSCIALGGLEARKLGSAASVHTKLHAGVDYRDVDELEKLFAALAEAQGRAKLSQSPTEVAELRKTCAGLGERIMAIRGKEIGAANAKINVKAVLYENVQLAVGDVTELIKEQQEGAFSVIENSIDGGLRFLTMTGMDVKAADMELAFVRERELSSRQM